MPCLQEDVANSIGVTSGKGRGADESGAGQEHLSLNQLVSIAEEGLSAHFPIYTEKMNWSDFINAAYAYRARIHISQNSWGLACETLGRITNCGDDIVRYHLYIAAQHLLNTVKKWCPLKAWGMRIAKRSSKQKAYVAVARKLSVIMHRMWMDGTYYSHA